MVREIIIPKENLAKVEEVREIENKELEQQPEDKEKSKGSESTVAKVVENTKEAIIPTVHASDNDDDDDLEAKIIDRSKETAKEARQHNADEFRKMERDAAEGDCKIL